MSVANPATLRAASSPRHSPFATWHLASRLARREVRRRKGRTLLVMLLVALPVFAMTVYDVLSRTAKDDHAEEYRRSFGVSDLAVDGAYAGNESTPNRAALEAMLPAGSRLLEIHTVDYGPVRLAGAPTTVPVRFTDLPLTDPMVLDVVEVTEGRVPSAADEVLLHPDVARDLGVGVGDTLHLEVPKADYEVVGLGRARADFDAPLMVVGAFDFAGLREDAVRRLWLVDVHGELPRGTYEALSNTMGWAETPTRSSGVSDGMQTTRLAWGWIGGVVALAVMGIVITAAFATSARRQLVTLGQLSANGAGPPLMRRTLALQGAWSGVLGSVVGVAGALVALTVGRSNFEERVVGHDIGSYVIGFADVLVIVATGTIAATVAAFIPARSMSRVPVLSALGGRRPLGKVPRRLVPIGVVLFVSGLFLLLLVTTMSRSDSESNNTNLYGFTAVLGGLGVLFGMCCVTPAVVSILGPVGERLGGAGRVAARSLARARTRSAAVVTAVAATGALAMAVGTGVASQHAPVRDQTRRDAVFASADAWLERPGTEGVEMQRVAVQLPDTLLADMQSALPGAVITPMRYAVDADMRYLIADEQVAAALGLSPAEVSAMADGDASSVKPDGLLFAFDPVIDEATAVSRGYPISVAGLFADAPHDLTKTERAALREIEERYGYQWNPFDLSPPSEGSGNYVWLNYWQASGWTPPRELIQAIIVAVALLLTLIVVAIGIALSAAESRDERDVLLAVGAPPWSMRRVAALKAILVSWLGGLLAVPTGFIPVAVVMSQAGDDPIRFPWLVAGGLVVAVPLVVGALGFVISAVVQRIRPVRMSNLAVD